MSSITIDKLKKDLRNQFEIVLNTGKELIIRDKGKEVVMLPLSEFNSLKETAYLLASDKNRKHLSKSLRQAKKGQVVKVDLSNLK
jgi:antitoxin YefM